MEFDSDDEQNPANQPQKGPTPTQAEVEAMQAFYAASDSTGPRPEDNMIWDATKNAYVWDDPVTGNISVWDQSRNAWVSEKEFGGGVDLNADFVIDEEEDAIHSKGKPPFKAKQPSIAPISTESATARLSSFVRAGNSDNSKGSEEKDQEEVQPKDEKADGSPEKEKKPKRKRKSKKKRKIKNKAIYVKGLPPDVTLEEMVEFFKKAGVIERDPYTMEYKIRIYKDENGKPKGDGLVTYLVENLAVANAFALLDDAPLRPGEGDGFPIKIETPEFTPSEKNPERPAQRKSKKLKRYNQYEELQWEEKEKVHVIIKHMFDHVEARKDIHFYDNLKRELLPEFEKCGPIQSCKIFERNPLGVVAVKYKGDWSAARCIEIMNGRYFDGRKLEADYYDGFTDYFAPETEEEMKERDKAWEAWLEGNDNVEDGMDHESDGENWAD